MEQKKCPLTAASVLQDAQLLGQVWLAGLVSAYGATGHSSPSLCPLADINRALCLVRQRTLTNEHVSLADVSILMLGLCSLVRDLTQTLSFTASQRENDLANIAAGCRNSDNGRFDDKEDFIHPKKTDAGGVQVTHTKNRVSGKAAKRDNEDDTGKRQSKRRQPFWQDPKSQLNIAAEPEETDIGRIVPDFALASPQAMARCRESVHLFERPARSFSTKLSYLFARNATAKKRTIDKSRSLTCDHSSGKTTCFAHFGAQDVEQQSESLSGDVYHQYENEAISRRETLLNPTLNLVLSQKHIFLPVRCRQLVLEQVNEKIDNSADARATASIKSIIFGNRGVPYSELYAYQASHVTESGQLLLQEGNIHQKVLALQDAIKANGQGLVDAEFLLHSFSRTLSISKQGAAEYFVALLHLAEQGTIELKQTVCQRLSNLHSIPKIYCRKKERK